MATKKNKNTTATKTMAVRSAAPAHHPIDPRKELLVRVAGSIAARLVASPSPSIASASSMAAVAVDIAEEILKKAGIPADAGRAASDPESSSFDPLGNAS